VVHHANYLIFRESTERQNHIGSTVVALLVRGPRFAVVWAGDSRLYILRDQVLNQVTIDHTQVQQLVTAGYLTQREAAEHPMSHVLSRAVGTQPEVETQALVGDVRAGDLFLLCSDGLPRVLEDHEIAHELESGNPTDMVRRLIELALERGSPDNVTAMVIGCTDPSIASGGPAAPIFGGAAAGDTPPPDKPAQPDKPAPPAAERAPLKPIAASAPRRIGASPAVIALIIAALVVMLGVGVWSVLPGLKNKTQPASQVVVVQGAVPQVGLRQFEAALANPYCSWLQIAKIAPGPTGVDLAISGIAPSPMLIQSALQTAAAQANVAVADIDLQSVEPAAQTLCPALDAMRPFRAATSQTGQNLVAAQDSFAVMKQADGKEAGRAIVTVTPPPQGDFAMAQMSADGSLSLIAANRQAFQTLATAGLVVSKVPDAGGYRLQADYAKPGWSSVLLITGQGPFPNTLLTQPAGARSAAWATQFATAARAGGWHVEMAWYQITTGGDLSVIPQTQAPSINAMATNGLIVRLPPKKPAAASNAAATSSSNSSGGPTTNSAAPPTKGNGSGNGPAPAKNGNASSSTGPSNSAKPDTPI
jgi:hypothetical protein